jgi:hypothetical protein
MLSERRMPRRLNALPAVVVAAVVIGSGCGEQPSTFVVDDFESRAFTDWQAVGVGAGGWFVCSVTAHASDCGAAAGRAPSPLRTSTAATAAATTIAT